VRSTPMSCAVSMAAMSTTINMRSPTLAMPLMKAPSTWDES
jgi:hypothetical protein